jgi:hypothetical protein
MRWLQGWLAFAALVAAAGACGSTIPVPDQGVIVTGCQMPAKCFLSDCTCNRSTVKTAQCVIAAVCTNDNDPTTCSCPVFDGGLASQCLEEAQACVGRGVFCGGVGAICVAPGTSCQQSGATPPMMVPGATGATLEPHCQFVDDVCCPGVVDGGVNTD